MIAQDVIATYERLLVGYANILASDEALDDIQSQLRIDGEEHFVAFIQIAARTGQNYKDAQSCRIVKLVSIAISKINCLISTTMQVALAEFCIARCSSLLEAGAVAEHLLCHARDAFLGEASLTKKTFMWRYLDALYVLNPRIMYANVTAKQRIAGLVLDWLEAMSTDGKGLSSRVRISLVDAYMNVASLVTRITAIFRGERAGNLIFLLAQIISILRKCAGDLCFRMAVLSDTLVPYFSKVFGTDSSVVHKHFISIQNLLQLQEKMDEETSEFLLEYLPLEYAPDPAEAFTAEELSAALLTALLHPSSPETLYQAIAERILETDTEEERTQLFLTLEAILVADARIHSYISELPALLRVSLEQIQANSSTSIPLNLIADRCSSLFINLIQYVLPEAIGQHIPSLASMCTMLTKKACNIAHNTVEYLQFSELSIEVDILAYEQKNPAFLNLLKDLLDHRLNCSLSPAGYADDLFYQITNELVYDQFPKADRPARATLLLMLNHYDKEISDTFCAHLEDVVKREIAMGSAENMKTFSGNCKLLCSYCQLEQGRISFATTFFNTLVERLVTSDVIEGCVFIDILNDCMALAKNHAVQACKFPLLLAEGNRKHWARFGLKTIVLVISFSRCLMVTDPILSGQLLETIKAYIDDTPNPDDDEISHLLSVLRYFYAFASIGLSLPTTHQDWQHILKYCQKHMSQEVLGILDTPLLLDAIRYSAKAQGQTQADLCSLIKHVDLDILRIMEPKAESLLPLNTNKPEFHANLCKELKQMLITTIISYKSATLCIIENILQDDYFKTMIINLFIGSDSVSSVLVEHIHSIKDQEELTAVLECCFHLSMCLHCYIFDSHKDACIILEQGLIHKIPNSIFITEYLSPPVRKEYVEICARLSATAFDTQYCLLMAMNALTCGTEANSPIISDTIRRLADHSPVLGEHGPRIVSAMTRYILQSSTDTANLHDLLSFLLTKLKSTDKNAFYAIILTLHEVDPAYAHQLTDDIILLVELLEDLPTNLLCGQILNHRLLSRQLENNDITTVLERVLQLLECNEADVVHCCAKIITTIGRIRSSVGTRRGVGHFLEENSLKIANILGSRLNAPDRATRDALRVARLVWMQESS